MPPLDPSLRRSLEKAVLSAREASERAAKATLQTFAVERSEAFRGFSPGERRLRNALRAKARQSGGGTPDKGMALLVEQVAYQQWHRMLFARFLAENGLLMHPTGATVTLQDCDDLAAEEGEPDGWQLAARYASRMLPGIFQPDDPGSQVRFAPEGRLALEGVLGGLPAAVFTADDSLGWVYQFWQTKRKKEVSGSGRKIERLDLAAYSQLFTEHYMVQFLLDNSLGAWWAARHPSSPLVTTFKYLRRREDGSPAAGTFAGWPEHASGVTMMDPCCGSGRFLLVAFEMLRQMRMEEERLSDGDAAEAVLRDNLFGLEIDPRCIQIAEFALALAAWKAGGYRPLMNLNLACSGIPVSGQLDEWTRLAGDDTNLRHTLAQLHELFRNAPDLGSLINPGDVPVRDRMFAPDFSRVAPLLERALARERGAADSVGVFGEAAKATARAADMLSRQYSLVATNVPYLTRNRQTDVLRDFSEVRHPTGKADLATCFLERLNSLTSERGSYAAVTPQNWLFLGRYRPLRERLLVEQTLACLSILGPGAFESVSGAIVNVCLVLLVNEPPPVDARFAAFDASQAPGSQSKADHLLANSFHVHLQSRQLSNPDSRIAVQAPDEEDNLPLLERYARAHAGMRTGDYARFGRCFWEIPRLLDGWVFQRSTVPAITPYAGMEHVLLWEDGKGRLFEVIEEQRRNGYNTGVWKAGLQVWGQRGVLVSQMQSLPTALYLGEAFDNNTAAIVPHDPADLAAIWAYCSSAEFGAAVRRIDSNLKVTNATLVKVPFDLELWQKVAERKGPLPEPHSNDPTQWLFQGNPVESAQPLQVAVARLLGYQWPQQEPDSLSGLAEADAIVPLPPVAGREPAAQRLRSLLARVFGALWSAALEEGLLTQADFGGKGLDTWLRDGFFEQHSRLFEQRPFIWHVWDGRRDGFSALINYHAFDSAQLGKLIYTYLGDWIRTQRADNDIGVAGADGRLVAALELDRKLKLIRDGEKPYDIYVRWKPLEQQPIGWEPDLDDGVRLNIRPFVAAGILRNRVNVKWNKDRGLNPDGSERINDVNLTLAEKQAARRAGGR